MACLLLDVVVRSWSRRAVGATVQQHLPLPGVLILVLAATSTLAAAEPAQQGQEAGTNLLREEDKQDGIQQALARVSNAL